MDGGDWRGLLEHATTDSQPSVAVSYCYCNTHIQEEKKGTCNCIVNLVMG